MPDASAAELVDLLLKRAGDLRREGVRVIQIGEFRAELAPYQPEAPREKPEADEPTDPLRNPNTYGLPAGSKIPGLSHLEVVEDKVKR